MMLPTATWTRAVCALAGLQARGGGPLGRAWGAEAATLLAAGAPPQPGSWFSGAAPEPEPEFEPEA